MINKILQACALAIGVNAIYSSGDAFKSMEEICQENGFGTESYTLVTPDDYVLGLYRIPGSFSEMQAGVKKPAVLIMHAQDCDMMEWVWNDSDRANAFILARAGYDVWLGTTEAVVLAMLTCH